MLDDAVASKRRQSLHLRPWPGAVWCKNKIIYLFEKKKKKKSLLDDVLHALASCSGRDAVHVRRVWGH